MKILLIVIIATNYLLGMETIICEGQNEKYKCEKYDGTDYTTYDYSEVYLSDSIHVYDFSDANYGHPDFDSDYQGHEPKIEVPKALYFLPVKIGPLNYGPSIFSD